MDDNQLYQQDTLLHQQEAELSEELLKTKSKWLRFLLTTMSIVLGILVPIGPRAGVPLRTGIWYLSGVVLLTLGILLLSVCLYSEIYYRQKGIALLREEARTALQQKRRARPLKVQTRKVFLVSEITGCICFASALFSLCLYTYCTMT